MISIYTLEGCSTCKETLELLDRQGITYREFKESRYPEICQKLQGSLNADYYPIVKIATTVQPLFIISNLNQSSPYPNTLYFSNTSQLIKLSKLNTYEKQGINYQETRSNP